ncbi:MAG: hypothetical protein JNK63_11195 [Chthonomonas sp.]|nr:hypothetical protein [Chthonomonas sp.]
MGRYANVALGLVLALAGCNGGKKEPAKPKPAAQEAEPAQRIGTGGISVTSRDDKRVDVWKANAKTAQVKLAPDGSVTAQMQGVTGDVYEKGLPAAKFSAKKGYAEQKTQALRLQDSVQLNDVSGHNRIKGNRLEWLPTIKMIQLSGSVNFMGSRYNTSTMETIWSSPDLKDIGTPHSFKNDPKMKLLIAPLLTSMALAQGTFSDDAQNMRLTFTTWRATRVSDSVTHFVVTGSPAIGSWKSQGLVFRARSIDGDLYQTAGGKSVLSKANLAGQVRAEMTRTEGGVRRNSVLTSEKADFSGDEKTGTMNLSGAVVATSALANGLQWMQMTGTAGTFKLKIGATQPLDSAEIAGPVTLRLISKRKNKAGALETTDMTATGRKLTFNSGAQEIELSGGVIVTGKGPDLMGRMEGERFRVILDPQGFVKEVYAEGNPGQATGRQP